MKMGHPPGPFIGASHMSFIDKTNEELKDVMAPSGMAAIEIWKRFYTCFYRIGASSLPPL
jgi:hypothetical protein